MKKILRNFMAFAIAAMTFVACEDVPEPYPMPEKPTNTANDGSLPYESGNLNSGWKLLSITEEQPWSLGSSYVQATGYQNWDGSGQKSNRAVEGWLLSPEFKLSGLENVKLSFDYTIKYTDRVQGWEANHKVFVSSNFDGENIDKATWTEINFVPKSSPYSDWTLYPSGEIQLPKEVVGKDKVRVGFWFKAPASSSTTWELKNFKIEEGIAQEGDQPSTDNGSKEAPLTVDEAIAKGTGANAWVKGYIVGYVDGMTLDEGATFGITPTAAPAETNVLIASSATVSDRTKCLPIQLPVGKVRVGVNLKDNPTNLGQEVLFHGDIDTYFGVPGLKNTDYAKIGDKEFDANATGNIGEPKGTGTANDPFNVAAAIAKCKEIGTNPSAEKYYVKGTVMNSATADATYNNITFDIADTEDGATFKCYQVAGTDGKPLPQGFSVKKGDVVVVYGPIYNYSGNTPETAGKSAAYIVSINGQATGGGDTPQPGGEVGSVDNPVSVPEALNAAMALDDNATSSDFYYIKGYVTRKANTADEIGPNSSKKYKDMNYYIADVPQGYNVELYVYRGKYLDGADFTDYEQLNEGDEVIIYGQLQKYIDTKNNNAVTPEVKNSKIVKLNGQGGNGGNDQPGGDTGFETGDNGNFEAWTNGQPDNWATSSTAGNATLHQDRDAHSGDYAVRVEGSSSANKRLAYKELKLKAGSYRMTFYAKAMAEGASLRPGIVPINADGKAGTYAYTDYVDNVSTSEWQLVECQVEAKSDGTYCFVIMNQKKETAIDILIDDFSVTLNGQPIIR